MTFRARLVLTAAYLLTAVVLALEVPLALNVGRRADADFRSVVLGSAAVLAARVSDLVATPGTTSATRLHTVVAESVGGESERILVTDRRGRVLTDSSGATGRGTVYATGERPEFAAALAGRIDSRRRFSETLGGELLLVTVPVVDNERVVGAVRVSARTDSIAASVHRSWFRLGLIGLVVVLAGLGVAWVLAGTLARPVARLGAAANRLGEGDLDVRVSAEGPKELVALGGAFNRMASALGANLAAQRDFLANASHQLRTPLTGVKLRLEAIRDEGGRAGAQAEQAEAELDRLASLVGDLLELARASSSEATGKTLDLGEAARSAVARWAEPARSAGKTLALKADGPARAWANAADVAHVLDNLIENALRYSPSGTAVSVETGARNGAAVLAVADTGPGIPADERERVFERFYRGSNGRRAGAGTGLGLAIVAELVERWGGEVELADGPGARVEARFPSRRTDS
jgi:signal transduction histidine kinase